MSDTPTLVHLEVDAPPQEVEEWVDLLQNNALEGYEFMVTQNGLIDSRTVVDRDDLVEDIADAVAKRLEEE